MVTDGQWDMVVKYPIHFTYLITPSGASGQRFQQSLPPVCCDSKKISCGEFEVANGHHHGELNPYKLGYNPI